MATATATSHVRVRALTRATVGLIGHLFAAVALLAVLERALGPRFPLYGLSADATRGYLAAYLLAAAVVIWAVPDTVDRLRARRNVSLR